MQPEPIDAGAHALQGFWRFVHGPLAHWAQRRPSAIALESETRSVSFAELHEQVAARSARIAGARLPAMQLLRGERGTLESVIDFLAIIDSGRCAAMADPDWPQAVCERAARWMPTEPSPAHRSTDALSPFYTGFTSGSTGLPKGFMRHHLSWTESFRVSLKDFGAAAAQRTLSPGRMSHSLFLFGVMQALWLGTGAIVQERFSALRCLATLRDGHAPCLVAVPSQLLLMLQWARQRAMEPIMGVRFIMISGARWMRSHTPALQALFPNARIVEFYGASEASFIAWMDAGEHAPAQAVGRPFSNVELAIRPLPASAPGGGATDAAAAPTGLIYMRSPMLFMDYVGDCADRTAVLHDGDWLSVRDMGHIDTDGLLHLAGRQSRMIVTRGKNLFPEELEDLLAGHPAIARASVLGVPDRLRGMRLHAVIQWRDEWLDECASWPSRLELAQWLHARAESFKHPRHWWICTQWPQTTSGKTDHARLAHAVARAMTGAADTVLLTEWTA
ncbi:AMP-binding protein [Diaphorobacter ruginosibacter]|uniref:AMP-binding protein n=1 Tax=Diaphorobacter ruginosibacter TaxID=1715720 RepID=UPI00334215B0